VTWGVWSVVRYILQVGTHKITLGWISTVYKKPILFEKVRCFSILFPSLWATRGKTRSDVGVWIIARYILQDGLYEMTWGCISTVYKKPISFKKKDCFSILFPSLWATRGKTRSDVGVWSVAIGLGYLDIPAKNIFKN